MSATDAQIRELAGAISDQAQAIADDTLRGPVFGAVARLADNVDTLKAWVQAKAGEEYRVIGDLA